jgi:POT family proton-dependent oligopeptide transporter
MKSAIMAFWSLSVTVGNLWVLLVNAAVRNDTVTQAIARSGWGVMTFQMFFFAAVAFLASLAFGLYAARYTLADHYRQTSKETAPPQTRERRGSHGQDAT